MSVNFTASIAGRMATIAEMALTGQADVWSVLPNLILAGILFFGS
jgi:hypothetical protein